jgi:hypothetical protein
MFLEGTSGFLGEYEEKIQTRNAGVPSRNI